MTCGAVTPTHGQRPTHEWQRTDVVPLGARSESKARVTMHRSLKTGTSMQSPTDQRRPTHAVQGPHVGRLPPQVVRRSSASATGAAMAVSLPKATQSIPPAVRRHVFHRDRGRCVVPGCTFGGFLDAHHLRPQAEGGTHEAENLVMLCGNHHIDLHLGRPSIEGTMFAPGAAMPTGTDRGGRLKTQSGSGQRASRAARGSRRCSECCRPCPDCRRWCPMRRRNPAREAKVDTRGYGTPSTDRARRSRPLRPYGRTRRRRRATTPLAPPNRHRRSGSRPLLSR